jgi:predicted ATPase
MAQQERTPRERETLIFSSPEAAQEFTQEVQEQLRQSEQAGIHRKRAVVATAVTKEFEKEGEAAEVVRHPWEHTTTEHAEAQRLVDIAFAKDLPAALRAARQSQHYPRILDLFHDVLTGEMYGLLHEHKLNRQPLAWFLLAVACVVLGTLLLLVFALSFL